MTKTKAALRTDTRGSVLVEYLIVTALAGVLVAVALATVGAATVRNYSGQRASLYLSNP